MSFIKDVIRAFILITAVLLAACADPSDPVEVIRVVEEIATPSATAAPKEPDEQPTPTIAVTEICDCVAEPDPRVTFNGYSTRQIQTLDPQLAEDALSIDYIENLFVQLTNYDPLTTEIIPEAAESWDISQDGRLYTFHLRTDIPWIYHSLLTRKTTQEIDEEGKPRFVTAYDFVFGIRRACHPSTSSNHSTIIAPLIVGCETVLNAENPDAISQELINAIGVNARDEATLTIELNAPASYFLSITPMAILSATPTWSIEEHGGTWNDPLNIVTNGRFIIDEWIPIIATVLLRNPLMPIDMRGTGNLEQHIVDLVPDNNYAYDLWRDNHFDLAKIPFEELESQLAEFPDQTIQVPDQAVFFISFQTTIPPFDNVHVRRAFSAAFDRQKFINDLQQGQGLPINHFAPPDIFAALQQYEIGIGFNPELARAEMEAAGYPNCVGFPKITFMTLLGQVNLDWIEFAQSQWQTHLGCSTDQISFRQVTASALQAATSAQTDDAQAPHLWFVNWDADYANAPNGVDIILGCNGLNRQKRACNEIDDLILEAAQKIDPARRVQLYRQIEEAFFGPQGEHPIIPIFTRLAYNAFQPWYDYTPIPFYGDQWYNDTIDM